MADDFLDRLAGQFVSELKGFFARRIREGEDPTTCLRMLSSFLESNRYKNRQFLRKIASRIDSSFFAQLGMVNQIASSADFIAAHNAIVKELMELDPQLAYITHYQARQALIANARNAIRERLLVERKEKESLLRDEYFRQYGIQELKTDTIVFFVAFGICLLFLLVAAPWWIRAILIGPVTLYVWWGILGEGTAPDGWAELFFWLVLVVGIGTIVSPRFAPVPLALGTISAIVYAVTVAGLRLSPAERSAYNTSLESIDRHFCDKEEYQVARSTIKILTMDDVNPDPDEDTPREETKAESDIEEDLAVGETALRGPEGGVLAVAFSPDGEKLASAGDDIIIIWDVATSRAERTLKGHKDYVDSVCFSPDGRKLASGSGDNTIIIWDATTGRSERTIRGHTADVYSVCFSPDGKKLASGSADKTAIIWDMATGRVEKTLSGHTGHVYSVCFSPDGSKVVSGSWDNTAIVWDVATGRQEKTLTGHADSIWSICFSPDGTKLASASKDNTVIIWDVETGLGERALRGHTSHVNSACFSPDGKRLASGADDNNVIVWEAETGRRDQILTGHKDHVKSICFCPDGKKLASGSLDEVIRIRSV